MLKPISGICWLSFLDMDFRTFNCISSTRFTYGRQGAAEKHDQEVYTLRDALVNSKSDHFPRHLMGICQVVGPRGFNSKGLPKMGLLLLIPCNCNCFPIERGFSML